MNKNIDKVPSRLEDFLSYNRAWGLLKKYSRHAIIAGGAVTAALANDVINDVDVYFLNKESRERYIATVRMLRNISIVETDNAVTISNNGLFPFSIQVITKEDFLGTTVEEVLGKFDFSINAIAVYVDQLDIIIYHDNFNFSDFSEGNVTIFNYRERPVSTFKRMLKYADRGWKFSSLERMKVIKALTELKVENYEDFVDALFVGYADDVDLDTATDLYNKWVAL